MTETTTSSNDLVEQDKKARGKRRPATKRDLKKSPGSTSHVRKEVPQIDRRPRIIISGQVLLPNRAQAKAIADSFHTFQFGDRIVEVDGSREKGLQFGPLTSDRLRRLFPNLTVWAHCTASGKRQQRLVDFGRLRQVEARGIWPELTPLVGVTPTPFLAPAGDVCERPSVDSAYDSDSQVYYVATLPIPEIVWPTRTPAAAALERLRELTRGRAEFLTPADESAWLAALVAPHARFAGKGHSPTFVFNDCAAGKMLVDVLSNVCIGRPMVVANLSNGAEWDEAIMAVGDACLPTALIANIDNPSALDRLNAVLTASEWTGYLPQHTGQVTVPLRTVWCAHGAVSGLPDSIAQRCLQIRLKEGGRATFNRRDLLKERARIITDVLTILRAYAIEGCRDMGLPPSPPFTGRSRYLRDLLVWLNMPDPVGTRRG
jgi:hypothetical protein